MKQFIFFLILINPLLFGCGNSESEIPIELIGNYYDNDGKDFWAYSLQKNFVIYDSKFWDVKNVKIKKDYTKVIIENENLKRVVQISRISGSEFKFESNKNSKTYSTIANSGLRKSKNDPFSLQSGKVKIFGFIKNSTKYTESTPRIHFLYNDYITMETNSVFASIDSLGRFELEMELLSPQDIMYKLDNNLHSAFVAPNDTLMIYFDPENYENTDFQGTNSDVNYDLRNTKERRFLIASAKEDQDQLSKHFSEYKAYRDSVSTRELRFLNEYSQQNDCSELFKIWYKTNSRITYYTNLFNYSWKNYYVKDTESSMAAFNSFLEIYFEEIDMNDTIASITGMYFFYIGALSNKIPRDRKSLINLVNNELPVNERKENFFEVYNTKMVAIINEMEKGRLKDILFAKLVSGEIRSRRMDNIDKTFDIVDEHIHYKPYLTHLSNYIASFKRKEVEFENNPITLRKSNSSGEQLLKKIINDSKDNVIILDFWFTGCGACRNDFKKMNAFKKDLSVEADVEFVYLCYSSAEKDWKYVSKEYGLKGHNYLLTQEQHAYFQDLFSISSAPRYILINKAGKVVNSNFRPPMFKNQFMLELKRNL